MTEHRSRIGLILGIAAALLINIFHFEGLSDKGQMCLALTLMTVIFWAFQVVQSGYSSGLYLALLVILDVADAEVVFSPWTGPTIYLVMGAYLIASAVKSSGLGERIAYRLIIKFVNSYRSIIISVFLLTFILSIIIPHPWPRAFLIMSVMAVVIKSAKAPKEEAAKIGFSVFSASVPISMTFLTGDSVLNPLVAQASGVSISWLQWFGYMGPPAIAASILTCMLVLALFRPETEIHINKDYIKRELASLGPVSPCEKRTAIWLVIAAVLWATDSVHGINIGWITLLIAMLMSFPVIGEVLTPKQWGEIPVNVLLFLTAAISIGKVGALTGMNEWIAKAVLPSSVPSNYYMLAFVITLISMGIHMVLGSVIAVIGIAMPAFLMFTEPMGINPLVTSFIVYTAISAHYILPFHHLNVLVGQGEENGMYTQREVVRLGLPLTAMVFIITVIVEISYWRLIGLI